MNLHQLQKEFVSAIQRESQGSIAKQLVQVSHKNLISYFSVYQNNYYLSLQKTITDIYKNCLTLVGAKRFQELIHSYIKQNPSTAKTLVHYGSCFADFVASCEQLSNLPYLSDFAKLEWLCHQTMFADDDIAFDLQQLARIPDHLHESLKFNLQPTVCLFESAYPLIQIWELCEGECDEFIDLAQGGDFIVIFRQNFVVHFEKVTEQTWQFLQLIQQGRTLGEICQRQDLDVLHLLTEILQKGWLYLEDNNR